MSVYILYDRVLYDGGLKAPLLYMTLCITTFFMYIKKFYDDRFIYLHVQKWCL